MKAPLLPHDTLPFRVWIREKPMKEATEGAGHQANKHQGPLCHHQKEPPLCKMFDPRFQVPQSADLGLVDVAVRLTVTEEDHDESCHIKNESQPQATGKSLHPCCDAPASLDNWGEQSTLATREFGNGGQGLDCSSIPATGVAVARVIGTVAATAVGAITLALPALDGGVPPPVLVRGTIPIINAINLERF